MSLLEEERRKLKTELVDARNLVAEVALGVTHYAGCVVGKPMCVRCRYASMLAKQTDLAREAETRAHGAEAVVEAARVYITGAADVPDKGANLTAALAAYDALDKIPGGVNGPRHGDRIAHIRRDSGPTGLGGASIRLRIPADKIPDGGEGETK